MKDSFEREARSFVAQWDRLRLPAQKGFADLPEAEAARPVISHAEWVRDRRSNPFRDFTIPELLVIDLADEFLRWFQTRPTRRCGTRCSRRVSRSMTSIRGISSLSNFALQ